MSPRRRRLGLASALALVLATACRHGRLPRAGRPAWRGPRVHSRDGGPVGRFRPVPVSLRELGGALHGWSTQGVGGTRAARSMFELGGKVVDAAAGGIVRARVEGPQSTGISGGGSCGPPRRPRRRRFAFDFRDDTGRQRRRAKYPRRRGQRGPRRSDRRIFAYGCRAWWRACWRSTGVREVPRTAGPGDAITLAEERFRRYPATWGGRTGKPMRCSQRSLSAGTISSPAASPRRRPALRSAGLERVLREIGPRGREGSTPDGSTRGGGGSRNTFRGGFITGRGPRRLPRVKAGGRSAASMDRTLAVAAAASSAASLTEI